jgi:hypothetical protein
MDMNFNISSPVISFLPVQPTDEQHFQDAEAIRMQKERDEGATKETDVRIAQF